VNIKLTCKTLINLAAVDYSNSQCLKWSKKEAGSLPQSEVECPLLNFLKFIFDLKTASFDPLLVGFYAI